MLSADHLLQAGIVVQEPLVPLHGRALVQQHFDLPMAVEGSAKVAVVDAQHLGVVHQGKKLRQRDEHKLAVGDRLDIDHGGGAHSAAAYRRVTGPADKAVGDVPAVFIHHIAPQNAFCQEWEGLRLLTHGDQTAASGNDLPVRNFRQKGSDLGIGDAQRRLDEFLYLKNDNSPFVESFLMSLYCFWKDFTLTQDNFMKFF